MEGNISKQTQKVDAFADYLERNKVIVNIRRSRGKDIDAACGQLANKNDLVFSTFSKKVIANYSRNGVRYGK